MLKAIGFVLGVVALAWLVDAANRDYESRMAQRVAERASIIMGNDPHVVFEVRSNGDGTFRVVLDPRAVQTDILQAFQKPQR